MDEQTRPLTDVVPTSMFSKVAVTIFIAGQSGKISGHTNESVVYPLNRAIVRAMMDEASLKVVEADKVFKNAQKKVELRITTTQ